jgi:hypothetical protein
MLVPSAGLRVKRSWNTSALGNAQRLALFSRQEHSTLWYATLSFPCEDQPITGIRFGRALTHAVVSEISYVYASDFHLPSSCLSVIPTKRTNNNWVGGSEKQIPPAKQGLSLIDKDPPAVRPPGLAILSRVYPAREFGDLSSSHVATMQFDDIAGRCEQVEKKGSIISTRRVVG